MYADPVVKVPVNVADGPTFLPDPKDGTLYALGGGTEGLKVSSHQQTNTPIIFLNDIFQLVLSHYLKITGWNFAS